MRLRRLILSVIVVKLCDWAPMASAETKVAEVFTQRYNEVILGENVASYDDIELIMEFPTLVQSRHLKIPHGFSVGQTIEYIYEVKRGKVCTDDEGIVSINGVGEGGYWTILLNWNFLNVNSHTSLTRGDKLELTYHKS